MNKTTPLVHNNWDTLEEIWLGDVWPENFYDDLKPEIRETFYTITQWTKEDLNIIQKKLEEFNVKVVRPKTDGIKDPYTVAGKGKTLIKPPICPRDHFGVIGDKLFANPLPEYSYLELLENYNNVFLMHQDHMIPKVYGSNIVKLGKDIIFDFRTVDQKDFIFRNFQNFQRKHMQWFSDYRLHYSTNGGHVDGCFMPVKPGLVLTTRYWKDYDTTLPGWQCLNIRDPSYITAGKEMLNNGQNGKWLNFVENLPPHFNHFVYENCKKWIGNYKETVFEVNMIMVDPNNMICFDSAKVNDPVYEELDRHGVKCHIVPWRTRGFWDGGLHCITLDIKRKTTLEDYFPERGESGLKTVLSDRFLNSTEKFLTEYNDWIKTQKE